MNATINGILAEYCTLARGSMLFPLTFSGFNVVGDLYKCQGVLPRVLYFTKREKKKKITKQSRKKHRSDT